MQSVHHKPAIILQLSYKNQSWLVRFFERKYVSYLCLAGAICIKALLYFHFFQLEGDKLFQALGAKNLIEGRGISFEHTSAADLSTRILEPVNRWPIGYSLLVAPFYWMTRNLQASCIAVDILSICFFFFVLFKILEELKFHPALVSAILLFAGSTFGPTLSKPTDLLSCAGLLFACLLLLVFFSDRLKSPQFGVAIGTALIFPCIFRYMYVPCALVIIVIMIWIGYRRNDKRIIRGGFYTLATACLLLVAFLMLQIASVGSSTYIMVSEKGFYPANLLMLYPFIADAFIDVNFILQQIDSLSGWSFVTLFRYLQLMNLAALAVLFFISVRALMQRRAAMWKPMDVFVVFAGAITASILLLLGYLSLTNSSAPLPFRSSSRWTFLGDGRYFLFPIIVLPIIAGFWLFKNRWPAFPKFQQLVQYIFVVLIFLQFTHTLYFLARRLDPLALNGGNVLITRSTEHFLRNRINQIKAEGYDVVLTGADETVSNWAALNGEKGILHVQELLTQEVYPKNRSVVFVLIESKMVPLMQDVLIGHHFTIENKVDGLTIFTKKL